MQVLITRPLAAAQVLARVLRARGHEVLIEPLLTIEPLAPTVQADGVQAIALTSTNALPALERLWAQDVRAADLRVFAVGDATAAAVRDAGCRRVEVADGDGVSLARRVAASCRPADGAILHLCGTEVRAGFAEPLAKAGLCLIRQPVYRARAARALSEQTRTALRKGIDAVLLFSPRTAETFATLVRRHGLDGCLGVTDACCLSSAVAEGCRALAWRQVRIAAQRNQIALLELLEATDRRC